MMTDDLLDRERPWDAAAIDRLLLDIAIALLERRRGQIDEIVLDLIGYYSPGLGDLHAIAIHAWLSGRPSGATLRRELGMEAEALFAEHEPGARFPCRGSGVEVLRQLYRDQRHVASIGFVIADRVAAHRLLAALARLGQAPNARR